MDQVKIGLKLAQTSHAKNKIRQFFKKQRREENIEKGRELVEKEVKLWSMR